MTSLASGRSSLEALASLRRTTREEAEQRLAQAVLGEAASEEQLTRAEQARASHASKSAATLAEARSEARTGEALMAVELLSRASREDAAHHAAKVSEARRKREEASLEATRARSTLARAQADEDAVKGRLDAMASAERALVHAREDDEADERSQRGRSAR